MLAGARRAKKAPGAPSSNRPGSYQHKQWPVVDGNRIDKLMNRESAKNRKHEKSGHAALRRRCVTTSLQREELATKNTKRHKKRKGEPRMQHGFSRMKARQAMKSLLQRDSDAGVNGCGPQRQPINRISGMEPNPYESPVSESRRQEPEGLDRSAYWALGFAFVAFLLLLGVFFVFSIAYFVSESNYNREWKERRRIEKQQQVLPTASTTTGAT